MKALMMMKTFKIGSHRTFYKILTFGGVQEKGFIKKREQKKVNRNEKVKQLIISDL
jgi:hypothetical protein